MGDEGLRGLGPDEYIQDGRVVKRSRGVQSEKFLKDAARGPRRGLPIDPRQRKRTPITTGVLDYFPAALAAVAEISLIGNDKHNPGQPLHWARDKSQDHADCIARHLIERGGFDEQGGRHSAYLAWRALANLQTELEEEEAMVAAAWERAVEADRTKTALENAPVAWEPVTQTEVSRELVKVGRTVHQLPTPAEVLRRIKQIETMPPEPEEC